MNYREIEKLSYSYLGKSIDVCDKNIFYDNFIKILKNCIEKNIKLDINENDYIRIINIYYDLYGLFYDDFLEKVRCLSINEINLNSVMKKLNK